MWTKFFCFVSWWWKGDHHYRAISNWNFLISLSRCYCSPWSSGGLQPFLRHCSQPAVPGPWAGFWHRCLHGQQPDYPLLHHQHLIPLLPQHPQGRFDYADFLLSEYAVWGQGDLERHHMLWAVVARVSLIWTERTVLLAVLLIVTNPLCLWKVIVSCHISVFQ